MTSGPRISVVVPAYQAERTIGATLDSIVANTDVPVEIIVIDDGSTDRTGERATSFGRIVKYIKTSNRGASLARNRGIEDASAEWIVFLDSDDMLVAGTLARRIELAESSSADVVVCDWQDFVEDCCDEHVRSATARSLDWDALNADAELACASNFWAPPAALMYRRSLVQRIGGFRSDLPVIQDARLLFDAAYHAARFAHAPHIGARYRVVEGSLSRRDPVRFWRDVLTNAKQIEALWCARGPLSQKRRSALADIYNSTARGLFASGDQSYFEAVERQKEYSAQMALHPRIVAPLASAIGLKRTRQVLKLFGAE